VHHKYLTSTLPSDEQFVSPGPTANPRLAPFLRCGCYSDDGNSSLALAESLLEHGGVVGAEVAKAYARAWKTTPTRGYPPTAKVRRLCFAYH
jgi:ADP-ribosylglycohydrolase